MRDEDIPEINNPKIRFPVLEGDKLMKEVVNGGCLVNSQNNFQILQTSRALLKRRS